jgi:hypothetical protein
MLKIRQEQMDVFNRIAEKKFEQRMKVYVQNSFPEEATGLSDIDLQKRIQYQIGKARSYGITAKDDICDYISICFVLGDDFDTDPALDSITSALKNPGLQSGPAKLMHLEKAVIKYLNKIENCK